MSKRIWMLAVVLCATGVAAQQNPDGGSGNPAPVPGTSAGETMAQGDEPRSVAEAARLARANKKDAPKAAKNYDDDNFQRSVPIVKKGAAADTNTADGQHESAAPRSAVAMANASLDEYKGKVVLLDFWATWCGVCREALPKVKQLQSVYGGEDFVVVSVSEDENPQTWKSYVASHGMTWAQKFDGDSSLMNKFQVSALPTYVLLGKDGQEIKRYEGEDPAVSIMERIAPDLKNAVEK
jgi:thiol-disulfide isomerase/thioredoxin